MVFSKNKRRVFLSIAESSFGSENEDLPSHAYGLASELELNRSTTGRHLQDLYEEGLIELIPSDAKRTDYRITDQGADVVDIVQNHPDIFLGETKRDILSSLADLEPTHGYEISNKLSLQKSNTYRHLSELESEGLIESISDGRRKNYLLTDTGSTLAGVLCV